MPIYIAIIVFQVLLIAHAIKTGRGYGWVFLILIAPLVGGLVYLVVEVLPDLGNSRSARRAMSSAAKIVNPGRDLHRAGRDLELSNNVNNKFRLAEQSLAAGMLDEAVRLYKDALTGIFADDPKGLLGLAEVHFARREYTEAKETLDRLIAANPDFRSPQGHLLYARTLEALGEAGAALDEYRVLAGYYPGPEAKCRYALLLKAQGRGEEAREQFRDVVLGAERAPRHFRRDNKEWIEIAKRESL